MVAWSKMVSADVIKKEASVSICLLSNSLLSDLNVSCDGKRGVKDNAMFLT